jgi:LacI family transcriptional regulator/LacI family repressor for deo operon, udp, cdd, tsx, nupC, and nupG
MRTGGIALDKAPVSGGTFTAGKRARAGDSIFHENAPPASAFPVFLFNHRVPRTHHLHMELPTQADIAKLAKVHRTTVSLALKGDPRIPDKTRQRIRKMAEKLGYQPDPMLSALIARRVHRQQRPFQGTLAWLVNNERQWDWRRIFHEYHEGAAGRAKRYGYNIDVFDLQTPGMTLARMGAILAARNIIEYAAHKEEETNVR